MKKVHAQRKERSCRSRQTIIGRLLYDAKCLLQGMVEKVQRIAYETYKNFEFAYLLDAFAKERQQGITIDTTQLKFSTPVRDYLIIDAPGHKEFLKNIISGATNANAAFLVIDAQAGVREKSRRHAYLLSLPSIKKFCSCQQNGFGSLFGAEIFGNFKRNKKFSCVVASADLRCLQARLTKNNCRQD